MVDPSRTARMQALVFALVLAEYGLAAAGGGALSVPSGTLERFRATAADQAEVGAAWLAQHMQWDFDDVDPVMPLSPFFRFDHAIKSKYLLPLGQETIRFSTTVRPTGRRGWVTTTVNPFSWLQVQSTVFSQGLKAPCAVSSAEVVLPLDKVTMQADDMLNRGLDDVQRGALGRTVLGSVRTQVLVGASTRDEPWIGIENDARISLSESKRPLRLRTRVTCSTDKQVCACYPISSSSLCACSPYSRTQTRKRAHVLLSARGAHTRAVFCLDTPPSPEG
jgi:hypothetical protein